MRLFLKDSERRPDPAAVKTDDRRAMLIGIGAWVVGLGVLMFVLGPFTGGTNDWWLWTCLVGIVLGAFGFLYAQMRRR